MSEPRDHWVYLNYDEFGEVLYVGCSQNLTQRKREHKNGGSDWFPYMSRTTLKGPYTYEVARRIERDQINRLDPWFNETSSQIGRRSKCTAAVRRFANQFMWDNPDASVQDLADAVQAATDLPPRIRRFHRLADYLNFRAAQISAAA